VHRLGKHYPGESLPRWAVLLIAHDLGLVAGRADLRQLLQPPVSGPAGC